ncbi:MAG TPA: hypothetical protein VFN23_20075 [Ktedonobacteraceae bacterium]|nr:hypothetical protein [Ktedonobacteraceae bacterium]
MSITQGKQRVVSIVSLLALLGALTLGVLQFEAHQHASAIPPRHPGPTIHVISSNTTQDVWNYHG